MASDMSPELAVPMPSLRADRVFSGIAAKLAGQLQDVIGIEDASSFMAAVGSAIAAEIDGRYSAVLADGPVASGDLARVLVDFKARIGGTFAVHAVSEDRIVLTNTRCPFGDESRGRPALCQMTSSVFGHLAAKHRGYARVTVEEAISLGHEGCRVVIDLVPCDRREGHEYFA
ncbi:transcriptional regulator [Rhodobacterales bacterium HKCCE2091]|nr:transcriptional regulator [Rhodobacterales bacterium HKCCE2091]